MASAIDRALAELDAIISKLSDSLNSSSRTLGNGTTTNPIKAESTSTAVPGLNGNENAAPSTNVSKPDKKEPESKQVVLGDELLANFEKCLFQVGKILSVENHPASEKLLICKVEIAPGEVKQVVAGLRKFFSIDELSGKAVCLICNLKPAKLAGQVSEAMILAGSITKPDGSETVRVLQPPEESAAGDRIYLKNGTASDKTVKQLSSKIWEKIVPQLAVQSGLATFSSIPLVTSRGEIRVHDLPDGAEIH